jgi:hypothetical protein
MRDDDAGFDLGVALVSAVLVMGGAWLWDGPTSRLGEWIAAWTVPVALIALGAGVLMPWTQGVPPLSRALAVTTTLGALGALFKATTLTAILVLSVIRSGLQLSWSDLLEGVGVGSPSGAWEGAVAGLVGGLGVSVLWPAVEGLRGDRPADDMPGANVLAALTGLSTLLLAGVAEAQHHAPLAVVTGCMADCQAFPVTWPGRLLGSGLAALGLAFGVRTAAMAGSTWRPAAGTLMVAVGLVALSLGHTTFTTTVGPRLRRSTLGLPPMPVPLGRDLVDVKIAEAPGWLVHEVRVQWADKTSESVVVGVGPFRPDTRRVFAAFQQTALAWEGGLMPGEAPPPPEPPAEPPFYVRPLTPEERVAMTPAVWREGCPVPLDDLALVVVRHHTPEGGETRGEVVVHAEVGRDVLSVFQELHRAGFPITRMEPVQAYNGSDDASMAADNTSGFNCRAKTGGGGWSEHSFGRAIDLNPLRNPYVRGGKILPPGGKDWLDRDPQRPGVITGGDVAVRAFSAIGWKWGGEWTNYKDYQHFSESGR